MITVNNTIEQNSLKMELSQNFLKTSFASFETSFDTLNDIETDDLEKIMATEFAQGLPSDTEVDGF
ncbi:MAG: hypothetical protein KME59_20385 [Trichormus sp. ATA11-4-KO1]|jgi:hypothetical protein|nr:hypothetical protein [Trichormus sp. ATA11-4-KO1]